MCDKKINVIWTKPSVLFFFFLNIIMEFKIFRIKKNSRKVSKYSKYPKTVIIPSCQRFKPEELSLVSEIRKLFWASSNWTFRTIDTECYTVLELFSTSEYSTYQTLSNSPNFITNFGKTWTACNQHGDHFNAQRQKLTEMLRYFEVLEVAPLA